MELLELMRTRRSIRSYKDEAVSEESITAILQAGLLSASGKAIRPWEMVVVKDKDTLMKLSNCRKGTVKMLKEAQCAIAVLGDTTKSDVWVEDCSLVMNNMHLMAHALGLGSCWVQGRLRAAEDDRATDDFVRDILGYPEHCSLLGILTIGVPNEEKDGYDLAALPMDKIHSEKF